MARANSDDGPSARVTLTARCPEAAMYRGTSRRTWCPLDSSAGTSTVGPSRIVRSTSSGAGLRTSTNATRTVSSNVPATAAARSPIILTPCGLRFPCATSNVVISVFRFRIVGHVVHGQAIAALHCGGDELLGAQCRAQPGDRRLDDVRVVAAEGLQQHVARHDRARCTREQLQQRQRVGRQIAYLAVNDGAGGVDAQRVSGDG